MKQNGIVIWLMGLSGAGKSTVANLLKAKLEKEGFFSVLLDGDHLRSGVNQNLTFSAEDRAENIRRAAEIAKILVGNNIVTICSFITPLQEYRDMAHMIIGEHYFEVFVNCPLEVCEKRDVKGLYRRARAKDISNFTGVSSKFEPSLQSDLNLFTNVQTPEESCEMLFLTILPRISIQITTQKNSHSTTKAY